MLLPLHSTDPRDWGTTEVVEGRPQRCLQDLKGYINRHNQMNWFFSVVATDLP